MNGLGAGLTNRGAAGNATRAGAVAMLLVLIGGCAGPRPPAPAPPPAPARPRAGYDRVADAPATVDASGFAGRRIVLDPGHGGVFRGALGEHGLTEAEVNLDVAARLRDLLQAAGAKVLMTRDTDRDFLTPADSSLRSDLAERMRLANGFAPDLFVSIHHNADAGGRHDVNETQTYYRLGDDGPSLDVAQDVHRALVRNVGIETNKVVPGNYFVLRNSVAPAILTETSYITNPDVEARLSQPDKRAIEADALYAGLARYFLRPVPVVNAFVVRDSSGLPGRVTLLADVDGAFDDATLELDGNPVPLERTGGRLAFAPAAPLAQGPHAAQLRVRLAAVGSARTQVAAFTVHRPVATLALTTLPARVALAEDQALGVRVAALGVRVAALDGAGLAVPEPLAIRVIVRAFAAPATTSTPGAGSQHRAKGSRASSKTTSAKNHANRASKSLAKPATSRSRFVALLDTTVVTRDGVAWAYLRVPGGARLEVRATRVAAAGVMAHAPAPAAAPAGSSAPASRDTLTARLEVTPGSAAWTGFVRRMPVDSALTDAPGTLEPAPVVRWLTRDGFAALEQLAGTPQMPQLAGYRAWADTALPQRAAPALVPLAGGALFGRRIVLDPEGGGDQSGGAGPGGTRAANLNLEVARTLATMLAAAGAEVRLTREADVAMSDLERVQTAEAFDAGRFLRIAHRAEPPRLACYVGSATGRRGAEHLATGCRLAGLAPPPVIESAMYVLQQTSCPSLDASLARIDDPAVERRLLAPGAIRSEAWALWLGLAAEWGADSTWLADSVIVRDATGAPVAGAPVRLGQALIAETDTAGIARFARTEPGPLEAEVQDRRVRARRVLLDFEHGIVLTGPR